jgi:membrane associated rhomboid family serine protease
MGIYERHYVREQPSPGGPLRGGGSGLLGTMRMWSANTWIIVLCVAVFVVDSFTAPQPVPADIFLLKEFKDVERQIDLSAAIPGDIEVKRVVNGRPVEWWRPLYMPIEPNTPVAMQDVYIMPLLSKYLHFSTQRGFLQVEFWRLIGFQFLHAGPMHLLFNMIGLYFFGPMVERYLGSKRYLAFYLLCGICGALMYTLLNLGGFVASMVASESVRIPGLLFNSPFTPLIGASAGVFGVLMAGAFLAPRATVLLFFILPMQLRTLAYALVALALFSVIFGGGNAGGEAGHLGGAIAGFYFIRHPHHLHNFFDILGWLDPTSHHYRKKKGRSPTRVAVKPTDTVEIDRILDKIREQGLQSLSPREKQILKDASRQ